MDEKPTKDNNVLTPQALTGCLDVLCKALAQVAPVDPNLAGEISEAINTIMEACDSPDNAPENDESKKEEEQEHPQKLVNSEIIEDIFTGEVLYKGLK